MDSSVWPKDENWFLRVCHHISNAVYRQNWKKHVARTEGDRLQLLAFQYHPSGHHDLGRPKRSWKDLIILKINRNRVFVDLNMNGSWREVEWRCVIVTETSLIFMKELNLIHDTSWQRLGWILPDTVNTVKCSWWWAKTSPETCRVD